MCVILHMEFYSSYILPAEEKKLKIVQKNRSPVPWLSAGIGERLLYRVDWCLFAVFFERM